MKLSIIERVGLLQILPQQGTFVTLKIIHDLQNTLGFTESELKKDNIQQTPDGRITWDSNSDKEIHVGETAKSIIKEALKGLDERKELQQQHFSLYKRFMES